MFDDKLLFWVSFFYYLTNIYSIIVVILLYIERNELAYFIAFFSIFVIDKLVTLIFMYDSMRKMIFWICDIFQVGFIYIFVVDSFFESVEGSLVLKIPSRLAPQVFLEFIFFFCLGILDNKNTLSSIQLLALINFLLFLTLFFSYSSIFQIVITSKTEPKQIIQIIFKHIYFTVTFYITLCTLTFYEDHFGINLGYYQFLISFLSIVLYLINRYPNLVWKDSGEIVKFLFFFIFYQLLNYYSSPKYGGININNKSKNANFYNIFGFFGQIFRIFLILCFNGDYIFSEQILQANKLKNIFTYATFILSLIYIVFELQAVYNSLFRYRYFNIKKEEQIRNLGLILQRKNYNVVIVQFYKEDPKNEDSTINPLIQNRENLKEELIDLLKLQIKYQKENKQLVFKNEHLYFQPFYEYFIINLPDLYLKEVSYIFQTLRRQKKLVDIYYQRLFNGFTFTQISQDLKNLIYQHQRFYQIDLDIPNIISITCFTKHISNHMIFQSAQILYDLYQDY
ncbi:hypothetical protein ABPG72_012951 [Tetrahymena utriculariae]